MNYVFAKLPPDKHLVNALSAASARLAEKMTKLRPRGLRISEYNQRYLEEHISNVRSSLQKYAFLLAWSLKGSSKPLADITLVDYGAGSGICTALAKELGVGRVIHNDIYDASCADAGVIGDALGARADDFVCGDADELLAWRSRSNASIDALVSFDVIEHIYDIDRFLRQLPLLSDGQLVVVLGSGANIRNPIIRRSLEGKQRRLEYVDRPQEWGHKLRDSTRAYLRLHADIIREFAPSATEADVQSLAVAARGKAAEDIEHIVRDFLTTRQIPAGLAHPTNTCDPLTGNWAEHLMDPQDLAGVLSEGFREVAVLPGFYGTPRRSVKRPAELVLNAAIRLGGARALALAPFFVLRGVRS